MNIETIRHFQFVATQQDSNIMDELDRPNYHTKTKNNGKILKEEEKGRYDETIQLVRASSDF